MRLPAIRHRLLLSLATAPYPHTLGQLAQDVQAPPGHTHHQLIRLREAGLVSCWPDGYTLRPGVVVGERSVGYLVPLDLGPWGQDEEIAACG